MEYDRYVKPTIAELLDELPKVIKRKYELEISYSNGLVQYINYMEEYEKILKGFGLEVSLPNALADVWLWLKENNLLIK